MTALCAGTASDVHLPTAGADNSSLPGMGGVFNTTNCHLYHYAGNNPVRYVDPEGRDAYAVKDKYRGVYTYTCDTGTFEGMLYAAQDFIPFGSKLQDASDYFFGYHRIDANTAYNKYVDFALSLIDKTSLPMNIIGIESQIYEFATMEKVFSNIPLGKLSKFNNVMGKVGNIITVLSVAKVGFLDRDNVAIDLIINFNLKNSLESSSLEEFEILYFHARKEIQSLIDNGDITYEKYWDGSLKYHTTIREQINRIKEELEFIKYMRKAINESQ